MRRRARSRCLRALSATIIALALVSSSPSVPQGGGAIAPGSGQTATRLADGRWLVVGGLAPDGPVSTIAIVDPATGSTSAVPGGLSEARAHHTATLLPDGTVLIVGGTGRTGQVVADGELFRPDTGMVEVVAMPGLVPRAHHTATVLTDGRVLLAGGAVDGEGALSDAQIWNPRGGTAEPTTPLLSVPRRGHTAALLGDGTVLVWGGTGIGGLARDDGEQLDPVHWTSRSLHTAPEDAADPLRVDTSSPVDNSVAVATDAVVVFRFSRPVSLDLVNARTVMLSGPSGPEAATIVPAEHGILLFVTPRALLRPATTYAVTLDGLADESGLPLPLTELRFTTVDIARAVRPTSPVGTAGRTTPPAGETVAETPFVAGDDESVWHGERRDGRPYSPWQALPPRRARAGVTALAGQALKLNGEPLADVTLSIERAGAAPMTARTDHTGRFLLEGVGAGHQELLIDGRTATGRGRRYGIFEVGVDLPAGTTTVLPYTIWLPALDTAHAVTLASPTTSEVVVTTPLLPGLEVRIPPGTVIRDHDGHVVREVSITPVPLDRPPFPLPKGVDVPFYFTVQPGAAYLTNSSYHGARLIYPSTDGVLPGTRVNFWNYDAKGRGWYVYGLGTAMPDGGGIVPDPRVAVYEFTGAMVAGPGLKPAVGPAQGGNSRDGDPVDLGTGLFVLEKTDLAIADVIPIALRRTYRPGDTVSRAFGLGTTHPYDMFLAGDTFPYTYMDLVLPDGGSIHYVRISPGTSYTDAVYETTVSPTRYYKSRIAWDGAHFYLTLKDGIVYTFREAFGATRPMQGGVLSIRDRAGNTLTLTRDADGNLTQITTPNGRWLQFSYDTSYRITQASDGLGRTVSYGYDGAGRLATVTDPAGGVTAYTYDSSNRMVTLRDARSLLFLSNEYDSTGKVTRQTQADGTTYQFAYTLGTGGKVTQTDVTDPRGFVRRVTFNGDAFPVTDVRAVGTPVAQTRAWERQAGSNLPTATIDALGRRMEWTYDAKGNALTVTQLAGTADAVTTTLTYEPTYSQVASVTNALNHTTTFGYDSHGNLTSITDPLSHATTLTYNAMGRPVTVTDALGQPTGLTYPLNGTFLTVTDPLGNRTTRAYDAAGRTIGKTDPIGAVTALAYDALDRVTSITDARQGVTSLTYDPNGNLLTLTDARGSTTAYAYDNMDRVIMRTDPLGRSETLSYDAAGHVSQHTDRKGQVAAFTYDALGRRTAATYADATVSYSMDAGNRRTQIADSIGGTLTNAFDGSDRLAAQTTAFGTVSYQYDAIGRRTQMTVPNQGPVTYAYDVGSRLLSIAQASSVVQFASDAANRPTSLTLANGIRTQYAYDAASHLTGLTYTLEATTLGDLQYTNDAAGNRIQVGGTWARTSLPQAATSATYNANNQQPAFGSQMLTYDLNGNLNNDGTNAYTWDARNRLTAIAGPVPASFFYDAVGRRSRKTISGVVTDFVYDGLNPAQEQSGQTITDLLAGLSVDQYFTRGNATSMAFLLADALGSIIALADSTGSIATTYTYEPFGAIAAAGAPTTNPYDFTGRESDLATLKYYRARYYHPTLQRFMSEDPIGLAGGDVNLYAYVKNDPVRFIDPSGKVLTIITGVAGGALAGAAAGGIVGGISGVLSSLIEGQSLGETIQSGLSSAGSGALAGALVGAGAGFFAGGGFLLGAGAGHAANIGLPVTAGSIAGTIAGVGASILGPPV